MTDTIETTDLILPEPTSVAAYFRAEGGIEPVIARIEAEVKARALSVATGKGRDEIKSLAYKVARSKTILDEAGKRLNEDAQAQIAIVNIERRKVVTRLDALKDAVRKPLDDWEQAEQDRIARHEALISDITNIGRGFVDGALVHPTEAFNHLGDRKIEFDRINHEEFHNKVADAFSEARTKLMMAIQDRDAADAEAARIAADRAELDKLRAEAAARDEADRQAAAKAAQDEADRLAEAKRLADIKAAADAATAAALAKAEAYKLAMEAKHKADADLAATEAAEREAALAAQLKNAQDEAARIHQSNLDAQAAADKARADRLAEAGTINAVRDTIATDIAGFATEMVALMIADAIVAGDIRHVEVRL